MPLQPRVLVAQMSPQPQSFIQLGSANALYVKPSAIDKPTTRTSLRIFIFLSFQDRQHDPLHPVKLETKRCTQVHDTAIVADASGRAHVTRTIHDTERGAENI